MENEEAMGKAFAAGVLIFVAGGCFFFLAIHGFVCWLLSGWLKRVPEAHRKQTPGMVWLLMIPLFNLFWNFMVFPKVSESFDSYFKSKGEAVPSTANLAQIFCIVAAASFVVGFIPILGMLSGIGGLAALVLLIILLVKYSDLKNRIPAA
jgi:hypothetical protein